MCTLPGQGAPEHPDSRTLPSQVLGGRPSSSLLTRSTRCDLQQKPIENLADLGEAGTGKLQGRTGHLPVAPPPGQQLLLPPLAAGPRTHRHLGKVACDSSPGRGAGTPRLGLHQVCGWQRLDSEPQLLSCTAFLCTLHSRDSTP